MTTIHRRYIKFLDFGDGAGYREDIERVRRDFSDMECESPEPAQPPTRS